MPMPYDRDVLRVLGTLVALGALGLTARPASARPASTGFFAEGGLGIVSFLPSAASDAAVGPSIDLRVGRDLFSWLSLGVYLAASTHEATLPPPPEDQYFQLYRGGVDARVGGRFDAIALFAEGGLGVSMISSNVLDKVMITKPGKPFSATVHAGAGVEYQMWNRHYAVGIAVDGFLEPEFGSVKALDSRLYLRYTYGGG
jgi:hypothetical protein